MATKYSRRFRLVGWSAIVAATLQTVGLIRYIQLLPGDWVGITLYTITLIAFIVVGIGSFIQAGRKGK